MPTDVFGPLRSESNAQVCNAVEFNPVTNSIKRGWDSEQLGHFWSISHIHFPIIVIICLSTYLLFRPCPYSIPPPQNMRKWRSKKCKQATRGENENEGERQI
jgi:hypothetical protein